MCTERQVDGKRGERQQSSSGRKSMKDMKNKHQHGCTEHARSRVGRGKKKRKGFFGGFNLFVPDEGGRHLVVKRVSFVQESLTWKKAQKRGNGGENGEVGLVHVTIEVLYSSHNSSN